MMTPVGLEQVHLNSRDLTFLKMGNVEGIEAIAVHNDGLWTVRNAKMYEYRVRS